MSRRWKMYTSGASPPMSDEGVVELQLRFEEPCAPIIRYLLELSCYPGCPEGLTQGFRKYLKIKRSLTERKCILLYNTIAISFSMLHESSGRSNGDVMPRIGRR